MSQQLDRPWFADCTRPALPLWRASVHPLPFSGWQLVVPQALVSALNPGQDWEAWLALHRPQQAPWSAAWVDAPVLNGLPVWVGVFPQVREIRLYSRQARQEKTWAQWLQQLEAWEPEDAEPTSLAQHLQRLDSYEPHRAPTLYERVTWQYRLPELTGRLADGLQSMAAEADRLANQLAPRLASYRPTALEQLTNLGLDLMTHYPALRNPLLRFVALLPSLDFDRSGDTVKAAALETLETLEALVRKPEALLPGWLVQAVAVAGPLLRRLPAGVLARLIRRKVQWVARRFIAGETLQQAEGSLKQLAQTGRGFTLDPLGEQVVTVAEAEAYEQRVLGLIEALAVRHPHGERNAAGLYQAHLSIKLSALSTDFNPLAPQAVLTEVVPRLRRILLAACEKQVFVNVDAEHETVRDLTLTVWQHTLLTTPALANYTDTGIVVQAYLRDAAEHLEAIGQLAETRGHRIPVRLVKGAYWDAETLEAEAEGHPAPQFLNKWETDLHFRQLTLRILQQPQRFQLAVGSHNLADHAFAEAAWQSLVPRGPAVEHQCLHQTYEALSLAMARQGWVVRDYVPVGNLLVGMAYLVRRLLENSSQMGVLVAARQQAAPEKGAEQQYRNAVQQGTVVVDPQVVPAADESFANVAPARLHRPAERAPVDRVLAQQHAMAAEALTNPFPVSGPWQTVWNPSCTSQEVGRIQQASVADVETAVAQAHQAFVTEGGWTDWPVAQRALVLVQAADALLAQRAQWAVWVSLESGKQLTEALADVDEAIDFLNCYARAAVQQTQDNAAGVARGVVAVVSPWNFPLAIPCGMVAAALATGNTVVLKSAEQTPLVAQRLVDLLHACGVPQQALIHLPGQGETVGQALTGHPQVAMIAFTGSQQVGLQLVQQGLSRLVQHPRLGVPMPVRVVAETGGKNAIVVTADADRDEAVLGILRSAFAHAGQKCSAASRVLVDERVFPLLAQRVAEAARVYRLGSATDWATRINPVIDRDTQARLQREAEAVAEEVRRFGGQVSLNQVAGAGDPAGCQVGPLVVELPLRRASFADSVAQRELFGPIVHLIPFTSLEDVLTLVNGGPYALTGGLFSQSTATIETVLQRWQAGNLYVNRTITGARVSIEPFGGFKGSGTGPKAGQASYLRAFVTTAGEGAQAQQVMVATPIAPHASATPLPKAIPLQPTRILSQRLAAWTAALEEFSPPVHQALNQQLQWVETEGRQLLQAGHPNRFIPVQHSVNRYDMARGALLVVAAHAEPSLVALQQVAMADALGASVTVVATTRQAWDSWQALAGALQGQQAGWTLVALDALSAAEWLCQQDWPTVVLDGPALFVQDLQQTLAERRMAQAQWLPLVLTPLEGPVVRPARWVWEAQTWERSVANYLLRYGANLA